MTVIDLLKKIQKTLKEERSAIAENMVLGRMKDHETYKKNAGIAEGLDRAYDNNSEMMKKLDDEEDA